MDNELKGIRIELSKSRVTVFKEFADDNNPLKTVVEQGEIVYLDWERHKTIMLKTASKDMLILKLISDIPVSQFLEQDVTECDGYKFIEFSNLTLMSLFG